MEEQELVIQLKNGNEDAYRFIVDTYQSYVLNCCYKFVKEKETAEDITQEVFIEVYRSIRYFRSASKVSTWLYRIAITKSLDHLKKMKRKKRFGFLQSIFSEETEQEIPESSHPETPFQKVEQSERLSILSWAIDSLPENQKIAFTLSKVEQLSYQEIAEILHTTVSAVDSLIHRAKTNLQKKLYTYYKNNL
jgi:RNA polymerase sigma-70 factor (ECF subfamily)